jgi:acetyltransferase
LQNAAIADPGVLDRVILTLVRVARLIVDLEEVIELELDPLWLAAGQMTVGVARIRVAVAQPARQRLAIRPYPRELEETLNLPDGSTVWIRPVRPEDEPSFRSGFQRLSRAEIRMRFMYVLKELTHEQAARLTQIDYDRDLALMALRGSGDRAPVPCGVARISGDADRERAEFAIVLLREATGIGLGHLLLRRLIQYAHKRGFREIFGEILRENEPMLALCRAMDFTIQPCPDDPGVMVATLALAAPG